MITGSHLYSRQTSCNYSDEEDDNHSSFAICSDSLIDEMLKSPKQMEEES